MCENKLQEKLRGCRLPAWEALPDFGLYMDQLVTLAERCFGELNGLLSITPAMINNYVKVGLIDRPVGKKYGRDSIAQLLMLCQLKQTVSMECMKPLLHPADGEDTKSIYARFAAAQDRILTDLAGRETPSPLVCALESASLQLLCRLQLTSEPE